jgi:hypothetical protein
MTAQKIILKTTRKFWVYELEEQGPAIDGGDAGFDVCMKWNCDYTQRIVEAILTKCID